MKREQSKMPGGTTTWTDYVEAFLLGSGMVVNAAIFGPDKTKSEFTLVEWASSKRFAVSAAEIVSAWKSFNDPTEIRAKGLVISDVNYTCIRGDSDLIVGRSAEGGCVVGRAKSVLIVATFDDPFQANCWNMVLKLITFLRNHGF